MTYGCPPVYVNGTLDSNLLALNNVFITQALKVARHQPVDDASVTVLLWREAEVSLNESFEKFRASTPQIPPRMPRRAILPTTPTVPSARHPSSSGPSLATPLYVETVLSAIKSFNPPLTPNFRSGSTNTDGGLQPGGWDLELEFLLRMEPDQDEDNNGDQKSHSNDFSDYPSGSTSSTVGARSGTSLLCV